MNDRGARLTPVDLLKSHLMSKVGDAEDEATELNRVGSPWTVTGSAHLIAAPISVEPRATCYP
jgi:hypothetical protein